MSELPVSRPDGGSLRVRMLVSASLVLVFFLGVMGLVLGNAFRVSAEEAVSERLLLHVYALITASEEDLVDDANSLFLPDNLQEPLFNQFESGLYAFVFNAAGQEIWRSKSALGLVLGEVTQSRLKQQAEPGVIDFYQLEQGAIEGHFAVTYRIIWQSSEGEAQYSYVVVQDEGPFKREVRAFSNNLWTWLVAGVMLLVAVQAVIMYWGLLPIGKLERDLKAIEGGERQYLDGSYPREINGVTHNLNLLLNAERSQRERYRNTLADLAHSLKTPLAIIRTEASRPGASDESVRELMDEQVQRMDEIVSYQLERAVMQSSSILNQSVDVQPVVEKLVTALGRVYQDKGISIESNVEAAIFAGDERDLMELLGNLVDNACKYGHRKVLLEVRHEESGCVIRIEDDGPGISNADRSAILERGKRLDSRESGQGIGLAVVAEILDRYQGVIEIDTSSLGGTGITVRLPGQERR